MPTPIGMIVPVVAIKKRIEEPEDLEQQLDELEQKMERLRVLFEQYFIGIEKRPPLGFQKDVVRMLRHLANYQIRKTSHKFRYQSLTQRFNVHRAYWQRSMREIEEGTNRRDRSRANRREEVRSGERIDAAELAKRALLLKLKGQDAVEARRERLAEADETPPATPYVPAVARQKRRRRKKAPDEIRGAPAAELQERHEELAAARQRVLEMTGAAQQPADEAGSNGPPAPPERPEAAPDPIGRSGTRPGMRRPSSSGPSIERPKTGRPLAPSLGRPRPAAPAAPSPAASPQPANAAVQVLSDAGVSPARTRRIYEELIEARQRCGQPTQSLTYERIAQSMARQVPKLRESHGALRVDFDVVTRDGKVFLKPRTS